MNFRHLPDLIIRNANIVNEGRSQIGDVLIQKGRISKIQSSLTGFYSAKSIEADGAWLIPGMIDDQVHFRDPGFPLKGSFSSESMAAAIGGITSVMDMPNTNPQTTTLADLEWKLQRGAETSAANYSFFFGGTNDNLDEIRKVDPTRIPGLKLFLGSSTGKMLVDNPESLERIFGEAGMLIAIHAEKEEVINRNKAHYISL